MDKEMVLQNTLAAQQAISDALEALGKVEYFEKAPEEMTPIEWAHWALALALAYTEHAANVLTGNSAEAAIEEQRDECDGLNHKIACKPEKRPYSPKLFKCCLRYAVRFFEGRAMTKGEVGRFGALINWMSALMGEERRKDFTEDVFGARSSKSLSDAQKLALLAAARITKSETDGKWRPREEFVAEITRWLGATDA